MDTAVNVVRTNVLAPKKKERERDEKFVKIEEKMVRRCRSNMKIARFNLRVTPGGCVIIFNDRYLNPL